jgi:hypothetical protein
VAQLYPQSLGSLFVASYDLQGYGWVWVWVLRYDRRLVGQSVLE